MFQGTVSWTFFHVSRGSGSAFEAAWRQDTQAEAGTRVSAGQRGARHILRMLSLRKGQGPL